MTKRNQAIRTDEIKVKQITTGRLTCGDCVGLTREVLLNGEKESCSKQGFKAAHKACPKFRPDSFRLQSAIEDGENILSELGTIIGGFDVRQLRALAATILNEATTRKHGFQFYQKVYVRFRGTARSDYITNFMTARILNADKDRVRVCSDDGKVVFTYENTGDQGPSIYTVDAFEPLKESMIKRGRINDPEVARNTAKAFRAEEVDFDLKLNTNGVISDISEVSRKNKGVGKRGRGKAEIFDLISIAREIERGVMKSQHVDGTVVLKQDTYKRRAGSSAVELGDL